MKFLEAAPYWLTPPGDGVHAVRAGKGRSAGLQKNLYGSQDPRGAWLASLLGMAKDPVCLLGVPSDNGGGIQRGANWGPLYVREAALRDGPIDVVDLGDVRVIPHFLHDKYLNQETLRASRQALYGQADSSWPVSPLSIAEAALDALYLDFPAARVLGIGGDHSVSLPLVRAWARSPHRRGKKLALLHFDAHTDLLDHRLGVDFCFGTWAYHVREFFPSPDLMVQVGIRSTGGTRGHWEGLGLTQIWAKEAHELGTSGTITRILNHFRAAGAEEIYISFDIDALDTRWASATGTPEEDGLDPAMCAQILRAVSQAFPVTGVDLMEVAPFVNPDMTPNMGQTLTMETAGALVHQLRGCFA